MNVFGASMDRIEPFRIVRARSSDAAAMAAIHRDAMPEAFLPLLGDAFLARLYGGMVRDPSAVALVARVDGRVVGFATAVPSVGRFYRRFATHGALRALVAAAPRLARPSVLRMALETARYPTSLPGLPDAELLSIAVASGCRANGLGTTLAESVLGELAGQGVSRVKVVVGAGNNAANRLYQRVGFRLAGSSEVHRGVQSNVWVAATDPRQTETSVDRGGS